MTQSRKFLVELMCKLPLKRSKWKLGFCLNRFNLWVGWGTQNVRPLCVCGSERIRDGRWGFCGNLSSFSFKIPWHVFCNVVSQEIIFLSPTFIYCFSLLNFNNGLSKNTLIMPRGYLCWDMVQKYAISFIFYFSFIIKILIFYWYL